MNTDSICLVLSGGGAKGIYHIGVWKALKELGVKIDAVVGNSIGAIIAAFLAEGRDAELEEIGSKIGLDFILNVPQDLIEDGDLKSDWHNLDDLKRLAGSVLSRKGLDTSPLRELLEANIHEQTIRNRGLDFGVVVYNLSDRKPREVFIEEMEEGELIHYVLASSAFPGFQRPEIAGKKYIDGGVYDYIPYAMAKARGYRNIIVVDISGLGVKRKLDIEGTRTTYIKNSIDMGGVLDFDRAFLDQFSHLGYLDTLRTYGRFRGRHYFLEEDDGLEDHFQRFLEDRDQSDQVRSLLPKYARYHRRWLPVLLDCAAKILSVERIRTWVYQDLFEVVESAAAEWRRGFEEASEADLKETMAIIRRELSDGVLVKTPYVYHLAVKRYLPKVLKQPTEKLLKDFSPELPGGLFLLDVLPEFLGSF